MPVEIRARLESPASLPRKCPPLHEIISREWICQNFDDAPKSNPMRIILLSVRPAVLANLARHIEERYPSAPSPIVAGFLLCLLLVLSAAAPGQIPNTPDIATRMRDVTQNIGDHGMLLITVLNSTKARLDRQSVIKLHDRTRDHVVWQSTTDQSESTFPDLDVGVYDIEVSAVGYLTEHKELDVPGTLQTIRLEVVLRPDPTAVNLNASDDAIPANARKDAQRAVIDLKSGNVKEAEKRLDKVYKVAPSSAQVNFLFGYLFLQLKDYEKSEAYLSHAAILDPRRVQTLTLLGRVQLQRQHYEDARKTLEQAVAANSGDWMAHNLLADAYLKQKEYEKAREQAQRAIDEGKGAGSAAYLVLGQALANIGRDQEGIQALKTFLQTDPESPTAPQVRAFIAEIEKRDLNRTGSGEMQLGTDLALAASQPSLPPSSWGPPGVDSVKPSVAKDVTCPYQQVMEMSGERVKQFVDNVSQFAATEVLVHEQLDKFGNPITKETRKFDYVASISEPQPGYLAIDEHRDQRYGLDDLPDHIVTKGFVALAALVFHPDMRENFQMDCEGIGEWQGQATWLVHFRQRDDKPSRTQEYTVGNDVYPVKLKGRAWITADNFQIVRIESDLVAPLPQFPVEHQIVEYGPVRFQKQNVDLWLPKSADIYLELRRKEYSCVQMPCLGRHLYYRRHSFEHYMLFSVNAQEKPKGIKDQPAVKLQDP